MNRRRFIQTLFASTAAVVVAPADALEYLPAPPGDPARTYVDMGRHSGTVFTTDPTPGEFYQVMLGDVIACYLGVNVCGNRGHARIR